MISVPQWNAQLSKRQEKALSRLADFGERAFTVLLFIGLVIRIGEAFVQRPPDIAVVVLEIPAVVFILFRRQTSDISKRPYDWFIGLLGTGAPMLVAPGGLPLAHPLIGICLLFMGLTLASTSKVTLNRSFGLVAANRGVVRSGAYKFVRHPIYAGYVIIYIGFFLNNPTGWNLAVYLGCFSLLVLRIGAEERVLRLDPAYAEFMKRVPYRMAPGIY